MSKDKDDGIPYPKVTPLTEKDLRDLKNTPTPEGPIKLLHDFERLVRRKERERCAVLLDEFAKNYPEDVFTPVDKSETGDGSISKLITRASAQMARHVCRVQATAIRALEDE